MGKNKENKKSEKLNLKLGKKDKTISKGEKDVFISYSSIDEKIAEECCNFLESRGYNCFFAKRDIDFGDDYSIKLNETIEKAKVLLLIFSKHADQSKHVRAEVGLAFSNEKIIIPYKIDDFAPKNLNYFLQLSQWLNGSDGNHQKHFIDLFERIYTIIKPQKLLSEEHLAILSVVEKHAVITEIREPISCGCFNTYQFIIEQNSKLNTNQILTEVINNLNNFSIVLNALPKCLSFQVEKLSKSVLKIEDVFNTSEFTQSTGELVYVAGCNYSQKIITCDLASEGHLFVFGVVGWETQKYVEFVINGLISRLNHNDITIYLSSIYGGFKKFNNNLRLGESVYHSAEETFSRLKELTYQAVERIELFKKYGCKSIGDYNKKFPENKMKYIVFAIEEFCSVQILFDKNFEKKFATFLANAKQVGIHLILTTARPESSLISNLMAIDFNYSYAMFYVTDEKTSIRFFGHANGTKLAKGYLDFYKSFLIGQDRLQGCE